VRLPPVGATQEEAFRKAYEGDPVSAFGGVISFNAPLDEPAATQLTEPGRFVECVVAPDYSREAFEILTTRPTWKKNVRLLRARAAGAPAGRAGLRRIDGGLLVQQRDLRGEDDFAEAKVVTKRAPSAEEMDDLKFAWLVCKHVKSNAIVFAKGGMVVGVGAGQMSRIDSTFMAARKAARAEEGGGAGERRLLPLPRQRR